MESLSVAFAHLAQYKAGSSRKPLVPLDQAVNGAVNDRSRRLDLEQQLMASLRSNTSVPARQYICGQLAKIGSDSCVAALGELLRNPLVSADALTALEAIPGKAAADALRDSLPKLSGPQRVGVLNSIGARRDAASTTAVAKLALSEDPAMSDAACAALGEIGTAKAARALAKALSTGDRSFAKLDAARTCVGRLQTAGAHKEANRLRVLLDRFAATAHSATVSAK